MLGAVANACAQATSRHERRQQPNRYTSRLDRYIRYSRGRLAGACSACNACNAPGGERPQRGPARRFRRVSHSLSGHKGERP